MAVPTTLVTITLTSTQAASIDAWLQKCDIDWGQPPSSDALTGFAIQFEDARWIGRWLREEPRLAVDHGAAAAIRDAISEAPKLDRASVDERLALHRLLAELDEASHRSFSQSACS